MGGAWLSPIAILTPAAENGRVQAPPPRRARLRIGELAQRTGVTRATIQHYLRAGLLPSPQKTSRTMAYYDPSCVERIFLIKQLQERYLPLSVIKGLIEPSPPSETAEPARDIVAAGRELIATLGGEERPLAREDVPGETGIDPSLLERIEQGGFVRAEVVHGRPVFAPLDAAILRALGALVRAGLSEAAGFRVDDLAMYRDAMSALLSEEVSRFTARVVARAPWPEVARLGVAAATGTTRLLVAMRNKMIAALLVSANPPTGEAADSPKS
jgi:DNA-binding transcriptional MerR regulator